MKNILLLTLVPVLIVTWGFGQAAPSKTTTTATTTEQASIKGCLAGSAGNYTIKQDGTPQSFKITTSAVNLKPHLGHDVELTGKRVSAPGFGVTDSTLAVTALTMISDHCATAAASAPAAADPSTATVATPAEATPTANGSAGTPVAADPASATVTTPAAPTPTPTTTASAPAAADPATATVTTATVTTPAATSTPAPADSAPPAAASTTTTTTAAASKTPADPASTPVMASANAPLPNTPAPSTKATKVTGKVGADGKTFVSDSDSKSWTVTNPEAVKGHEGHHVVLTAHVDADTNQVNVVSLKMAK